MSHSPNEEKKYTQAELTGLASQVNEGLGLGISETTWRTSLRVFEIMRKENPIMATYNPFLRDYRRFVTLMVGHFFSGRLIQARIQNILDAGDRFEESENHPLLYDDVIEIGQNTRLGTFFEIHFHELLDRGYSFPDAIVKTNNDSGESLLAIESTIALRFTQADIPYYRLSKKGGAGSDTQNPKLSILV